MPTVSNAAVLCPFRIITRLVRLAATCTASPESGCECLSERKIHWLTDAARTGHVCQLAARPSKYKGEFQQYLPGHLKKGDPPYLSQTSRYGESCECQATPHVIGFGDADSFMPRPRPSADRGWPVTHNTWVVGLRHLVPTDASEPFTTAFTEFDSLDRTGDYAN